VILMGAAAGVALLALSLVGGRQPAGEAIAAVSAPTPPLSAPATLPPAAPEAAPSAPAPEAAPSAPAPVAAPVTDEARPAKAKKARHHRNRALVRGKRH
jgi:hypothetical protein